MHHVISALYSPIYAVPRFAPLFDHLLFGAVARKMARIPSFDFNNLVNELELIEGDISGQRQFLVEATAHVGPVI